MKFIEVSESVGKTVKSFKESDNEELFVVVFTDSTYTAISAEGYEYVSAYNKDLTDFGDEVKVEFGLMSKDEYAEKIEAEKVYRESRIKDRELQEYNRLKAKFEN